MSEHAALPPSSAKEWGNCDGWLVLNESTPEPPETDAAHWGTECHAIAASRLESARTGGLGQPACTDSEMDECAQLYVDHCYGLMRAASVYGGDRLGIEAKVQTRIPGVWGTVDFYVYDEAGRVLYIRDLKTGRLLIDPDDDQLVLYADGVIELLGLSDLDISVDLGVVQPRGFHPAGSIRTMRGAATDLRGRLNQLTDRAEANQSRKGEAQAGPHCYQCKARTRCPAAIESGQSLLYAVSEAVPADLQPAEVGLLLRDTRRAIKFLGQMEKAYSGQAEGLIKAGQRVPGWALQTQMARSKDWTVDDEQVLLLGQLYGADFSKPGLITPSQAEKKGIPADVISGYCTRRQIGVKLSESNDDDLANIFRNIKS